MLLALPSHLFLALFNDLHLFTTHAARDLGHLKDYQIRSVLRLPILKLRN